MTRCAVVAPDGRRCVAPEHAGKHSLSVPTPSKDQMLAIAALWGLTGSVSTKVAVTLSAGKVSADVFVSMLEMFSSTTQAVRDVF